MHDNDGKESEVVSKESRSRITVRPGARRTNEAEDKTAVADGSASTAAAAGGGASGTSPSSPPSQATIALLTNQIDRLARDMNKAQLRDYVELTHKPWLLIWRSFISGLSRGIGIALGFTFFAATIVWILQLLGALNLPIVGDYIADIVRIVNRQLEINPY